MKASGALRPDVVAMLQDRQAEAHRLGCDVAVELGDVSFSMAPSRIAGRCRLAAEGCTVILDEQPRCSGGWRFEVQITGTWLAACRSHREPLDFSRRLAHAALSVVTGERLVRVDLAVDVVGLPIDRISRRAWLTKGRAPVNPHYGRQRSDDEGGALEGWKIGTRGEFYLRVYDKTLELAAGGDEDKREHEYAMWKAAGWDGTEAVTRVEYEFIGEVLEELDFCTPVAGAMNGVRGRDPETFIANIDRVWRYATDARRLVLRRTATRAARCRPDPRWDVVRAATFDHADAAPARRTRKHRGFADARRVVSTALRYGIGQGILPRFDMHDADGVLLTAAHWIESQCWSEQVCEVRLHGMLQAMTESAVRDAIATLKQKLGSSRDALAWVIEKVNTTHAVRPPIQASETTGARRVLTAAQAFDALKLQRASAAARPAPQQVSGQTAAFNAKLDRALSRFTRHVRECRCASCREPGAPRVVAAGAA